MVIFTVGDWLLHSKILSLVFTQLYTFSIHRNGRSIASWANKKRRIVNETLNGDLIKISECGQTSKLSFKPKLEAASSCTCKVMNNPALLMLQRIGKLEEWASLRLFGIRIHNAVRWKEHVFENSKDAAKGLRFLKQDKKYINENDIWLLLLRVYLAKN